MLKYNSRWVRWIFYFVDQWAEIRCPGLEALEDITFIIKAELTDTFDHDGLLALIALTHRLVRDSRAKIIYISYFASQIDSWSCLVMVYVLDLPLIRWPSRKRGVMAAEEGNRAP